MEDTLLNKTKKSYKLLFVIETLISSKKLNIGIGSI